MREVSVIANRATQETASGGVPVIERRAEIDYVKGLAIILVFFIHAEPLKGSWAHAYVVDRAVPMFLVLFGLTSHMWWKSRGSLGFWARWGRWYKGRFQRLVPPVWVVLTIWWLFSLWLPGYPTIGFGWIVANYLGYTPWIGTFWFVTLIFQLILLYPILQGALDRLGIALCLSLAALAAVWSHLHTLEIVVWLRALLRDTAPGRGLYLFYYFWIFPLQYFWLVFAGMGLARWNVKRVTVLLAGTTAFAAGVMLHSAVAPHLPLAANAIQRLADVPLTFTVLVSLSFLKHASSAGRWLSWFGRHSWGLYLAQMLIHHMAWRLGYDAANLSVTQRWQYLACLLAASLVIVAAADALGALARNLITASRLAFGSRSTVIGWGRTGHKNRD